MKQYKKGNEQGKLTNPLGNGKHYKMEIKNRLIPSLNDITPIVLKLMLYLPPI